MKSKYDKNEKKESSEKMKSIINKNDSKSDNETSTNERSPLRTNSQNSKNALLCPKSVRNNFKKSDKTKEKNMDFLHLDKGFKDESKLSEVISKCIKKAVTKISNDQIIPVIKINKESVDWPMTSIKQTDTKPSLIYSYNPSILAADLKHLIKSKKKKKHLKSKIHELSDNEMKDSIKKLKKSRKSKKKRNKCSDLVNVNPEKDLKKELKKESLEIDDLDDSKNSEVPKSFLVSYSSDEDDTNIDSSIKKSPEIKLEEKCNPTVSNKSENKIEIKLKPTKSPGKSTWESSESELETDAKKELKQKISIIQVKSPNTLVISPQIVKSKSKSKGVKSNSRSLSESRSSSRSGSHNTSYSSSRSGSYSDYSERSSRSYSRSRSHSKSKRHSRRRRRRHYSSSSSSYSRSRSRRYHSHSSSKTSYSRSSRSYTRSRSRYKSSYSSRYRSRTRSHSSRSRSNSYYRSSYRKRKRSSSTDRFLNVPTRKVKPVPIRNSVLQGGPPRHVDIGKKIDAIKEAQRKAFEVQNNENLSSLNIPLPPEKPKGGNTIKTGDSLYASIDLSGPAAKKSKKGNNIGNKNNNPDIKTGEKVNTNNNLEYQSSEYIGPQVSSDMAKRLGLDFKSNNNNNMKKDKIKDNYKVEPITSDSFLAPQLDASHMALQSRAYQHRLYNHLQGGGSNNNNNQEAAAAAAQAVQAAQYYHPLYMSASSLSNNLTAIASAAVANEQLPASVAGSLAQAAVQRIMSSSNLTATYNTPSVMASPSAAATSLQTALHGGLPNSCGGFVANTPSGLIPISLLQQGGFQVGINPLMLQQLQQQALNAQFGQAMSIPSQHILSNVNQLFLQAQNQQALLQSLGVNAQAQLLGSPLNFQHTLLMAAQQQQQQQLFAAAQINQATLQAAHLQAQIQAQARAVSIQNLQQAAQMQSSAQNAATASLAANNNNTAASAMPENCEKQDNNNIIDQMLLDSEKNNMFSDNKSLYSNESNSVMLQESGGGTSNNNNEASGVQGGVVQGALDNVVQCGTFDCDNNIMGTSSVYNSINNNNNKQQAPRIIYSSPAVMEPIDISSNLKS